MNTNWLKSNVEDILKEVSSNTSSHDYFKYFAGTKESKISFEWFFKCLNLLEIHHDPDLVSREICLPPELVSYWYENAKQLGQLRSQKNNSRLFNFKNANPSNLTLKPAMIETTEELSAMTFFYNQIQKSFEKKPDQIKYVLNSFLNRVTISHTGIHYRWNKINQLETFYNSVQELFPAHLWNLLGQNLIESLDKKKQPLLMKLAKSTTSAHPSTQEQYVRLQLYSIKNQKALAAFKFCLHLACIARPRSIDLKIE